MKIELKRIRRCSTQNNSIVMAWPLWKVAARNTNMVMVSNCIYSVKTNRIHWQMDSLSFQGFFHSFFGSFFFVRIECWISLEKLYMWHVIAGNCCCCNSFGFYFFVGRKADDANDGRKLKRVKQIIHGSVAVVGVWRVMCLTAIKVCLCVLWIRFVIVAPFFWLIRFFHSFSLSLSLRLMLSVCSKCRSPTNEIYLRISFGLRKATNTHKL